MDRRFPLGRDGGRFVHSLYIGIGNGDDDVMSLSLGLGKHRDK
jgi:hypothetical protein